MAEKKTAQAMKITASWTPLPKVAAQMMEIFKGSGAEGIVFTSGRMSLALAIRADYADPEHTALVSEHIADVKHSLVMVGALHSFNVTAGSVPIGEAIEPAKDDPEVLPEEAEPEAKQPEAPPQGTDPLEVSTQSSAPSGGKASSKPKRED